MENMEWWVQLIQAVGVPLALVIFFIWKGDKRETAYSARIMALEEFQKKTLLELVKTQSEIMATNSSVLERCIAIVELHEKNLADRR